jgi:hypothetical protein
MEGVFRYRKGKETGRSLRIFQAYMTFRGMTLPLASSQGASLKAVGSGGLTMFLINTHSCFLLMRFGRAASQTSAYPAHSRKQTQRVSHVGKNKNTIRRLRKQEKEKKEAIEENKVKDGEKGKR